MEGFAGRSKPGDEPVQDIVERVAGGAGGEVQRHAVAQGRGGEGGDILQAGRQAVVQQGAGAHGEHERLRGARAGAPGKFGAAAPARTGVSGRAPRTRCEDRIDDRGADRHGADQMLRFQQVFGGS